MKALLGVTFAAGLLLSPAHAEASPCDPHARDLDRARSSIVQQRYGEATSIVDRVLKSDPNDFRANYQMGLVIVDQADAADRIRWTPATKFPQGMAYLLKAAELLPHLDQTCAQAANFFTIYNTIGAEYLNRAHFAEAEKFLLKAYAVRERLPRASQVKVLDNLGLVYFSLAKFDLSRRYYSEARTAGSRVAVYQLAAHRELADSRPLIKERHDSRVLTVSYGKSPPKNPSHQPDRASKGGDGHH